MHGYVVLGEPSHLYLDPWELEVYISHVCLSGTKAMNHVSSSQTHSVRRKSKQMRSFLSMRVLTAPKQFWRFVQCQRNGLNFLKVSKARKGTDF